MINIDKIFFENSPMIFSMPVGTYQLPTVFATKLSSPSPVFSLNKIQRSIGSISNPDDLSSNPASLIATEHQIIIDLALEPDATQKDWLRTNFLSGRSMVTGYLFLWRKSKLEQFGWETASIFGSIADEEKYAFVLVPNKSLLYYPLTFPVFFPSAVSFPEQLFYLNLTIDDLLLQNLIKSIMPMGLAKLLIEQFNQKANDEGRPNDMISTGHWESDYLQLFLYHEHPISILGDEAIGSLKPADNSYPDRYRLSTFAITYSNTEDDTVSIGDYSAKWPDLLINLQRAFIEKYDEQTDETIRMTLAGNPLVSLETVPNRPVEAGRLDILKQDDFLNYGKLTVAELNFSIDLESYPPKMVVQNPPPNPITSYQNTPYHIDLVQFEHGTSRFTLFNPDQLNLKVELVAPAGQTLNGLNFVHVQQDAAEVVAMSHSVTGSTEHEFMVRCTQPKPTVSQFKIDISMLDSAMSNARFCFQIDLAFLDFKTMPLAFRYVDPQHSWNNNGTLNLDDIIFSINEVLGKQGNVFVYVPEQDLNGAMESMISVANADVNHFMNAILYPDLDAYEIAVTPFQTALNQDDGPHQIQFIGLPKLPGSRAHGHTETNPPGGFTTPLPENTPDFPYSTILIRLNQVSDQAADNIGDAIAAPILSTWCLHELGHYLTNRFNSDNPVIDMHHRHPGLGEDELFFNIFNAGIAAGSPLKHMTVNQALVFNDHAAEIQ